MSNGSFVVNFTFPSLLFSPMLLLGVGAFLFAVAQSLPRRLALFLVAIACLGSAFFQVSAFLKILELGGWADFQLIPFKGAQLHASAFHDALTFTVRAKNSLLLVLLHLAVGLLFWNAFDSSAGGMRRTFEPLQISQMGLALLGLAGLVVILEASTFSSLISGAFLASSCALGMLFFAAPERDDANAASSVYLIHVIADVFILAAASLAMVATGTENPFLILQQLLRLLEQAQITIGPLYGFPSSWVTTTLSIFLALAFSFRLIPFFLNGFWLQARGASFSTLSFAHHFFWLGGSLLFLDATAPFIALTPWVLNLFSLMIMMSALWQAFSALAQNKLDALFLHLPFSFGLLAALAILHGSPESTPLAMGLFWLGCAVFSALFSRIVEIIEGELDIYKMGGLWQRLRRTETAMTLNMASWSLLPFTGTSLLLAQLLAVFSIGPSSHKILLAAGLLWAFSFTFSIYRLSFLVFSGDDFRGETASSNEKIKSAQSFMKTFPPLFFSLLTLVLPFLFVLPQRLLQFLLPTFRAPLLALVEPESLPMKAVQQITHEHVLSPAPIMHLSFFLILFFLSIIAWFLAAFLFKKRISSHVNRLSETFFLKAMKKLLLNNTRLVPFLSRFVVEPIDRIGKGVWSFLYPVVVEGGIHRLSVAPFSVAGFFLRILNNGDAQRGLMVVLVMGAALLSWWSLR